MSNNFKISISVDCVSADFETAILLGLEWGLEHFELKRLFGRRIPNISKDEVDYIKKILDKYIVKISSISPGLFKNEIGSEVSKEEINNKLPETIKIANQLGTKNIVLFGFAKQKNTTVKEAIEKISNIYGEIANKAEKEGIRIFIENERGTWVNSHEVLLKVIKNVNSDYLMINWDPCNLIGETKEKPFPDVYNKIKAHVGHMHLKDGKIIENKFTNIMMGKGEVDWIGQFSALRKNNYKGFCVLEPHFGDRVESSRQHIFETRKLIRISNKD